MERKAVAMISGGLDSSLAVRIIRNQGIEVAGFHVRNPFECCKGMAARQSTDLGIQVTSVSIGDDYFEMLKKPRHNYGRGANPCTDCRIYVARLAKEFMEHVGASFVISGEVIGQRPNSQMRDSLRAVEKQSGLEGLLLRPLSAKLLKPTIPELEGIVDRSLLYDFEGRSRRPLIALAKELGLKYIPDPSVGCALCREEFGRKVFDLMEHDPEARSWDFLLLRHGRHLRLGPKTKLIVGRNESENDVLEREAGNTTREDITIVRPHDFDGASGLLIGDLAEPFLRRAAAILAGYSKKFHSHEHHYEYGRPGTEPVVLGGVETEDRRFFRDALIAPDEFTP